MKAIKTILITLVAILLILVVVGFFLPSAYRVERSTIISAPAEIVFNQVNDVRNHNSWSPWKDADPTIVSRPGPIMSGRGAVYSWTSKSSGSGSLTITESRPFTYIKIKLDFKSEGKAVAIWTFKKQNEGVLVTESLRGDAGMNIPGRYFGLMMDSMVGPYFEKGLAKLKKVSEAEAKKPTR